ncbi:uncharacterized protein LOC129265206 [Lytechinus pictus]|uniref:uncharacterized protein LOC129265206 n=1 Tax=Lytechinus pictus TaxID=7653 RepID=UPI0030B9FC0B
MVIQYQARDPESRIWMAVTVLSRNDLRAKVRWTNYRNIISDIPTTDLRVSLLKRLLPRELNKELWPGTSPFNLQLGDKFQLVKGDGSMGEIATVRTNDPFRGIITTTEHGGRQFRYEHIAEAPEQDTNVPVPVQPPRKRPQVADAGDCVEPSRKLQRTSGKQSAAGPIRTKKTAPPRPAAPTSQGYN